MSRFLVISAVLIGVIAGCTSLSSRLSSQRTSERASPTEGVDAFGQVVRLSDYRDKVVLLSFWHSKCPPCRAMFPHERALVQKYAGQPFVLLGVNADHSPELFRETQEKAGLTWRSIYDGSGGHICAAWDIEYFPTFVLMDPTGTVRWRKSGKQPEGILESKIDELLRDRPH